MPVQSSQIIEDAAQHDGRRYLRYLYTLASGREVVYGPKKVPAAFDADADRIARVPQIETDAKQVEQWEAVAAVQRGIALSVIQANLQENTSAEIATIFLKIMANQMRTVTHETLDDELPVLARFRKVWDELTNQQIANLLGEPQGQVSNWRNVFDDMETAILDYDHSLPTYEDVI